MCQRNVCRTKAVARCISEAGKKWSCLPPVPQECWCANWGVTSEDTEHEREEISFYKILSSCLTVHVIFPEGNVAPLISRKSRCDDFFFVCSPSRRKHWKPPLALQKSSWLPSRLKHSRCHRWSGNLKYGQQLCFYVLLWKTFQSFSGLKMTHRIFTVLASCKELCKHIHPHLPTDFTQPENRGSWNVCSVAGRSVDRYRRRANIHGCAEMMLREAAGRGGGSCSLCWWMNDARCHLRWTDRPSWAVSPDFRPHIQPVYVPEFQSVGQALLSRFLSFKCHLSFLFLLALFLFLLFSHFSFGLVMRGRLKPFA